MYCYRAWIKGYVWAGMMMDFKDVKIKLKSNFENSMKVDIEELKKEKKDNFKERLDFIDRYVEWIKATPTKSGRSNIRIS